MDEILVIEFVIFVYPIIGLFEQFFEVILDQIAMLVVACALEQPHINAHYLLKSLCLVAAAPEKGVQFVKDQLQSLSNLKVRLLLNITLVLFVHPPA